MEDRASNRLMKRVLAVLFAMAAALAISLPAAQTASAAEPEGMGDLGGIYVIDASGDVVSDVIPVKSDNVDAAIKAGNAKTDWGSNGKTIVYDLGDDWHSKYFAANTRGDVLIKLNGNLWDAHIVDGDDEPFKTGHTVTIEGADPRGNRGTISVTAHSANSLIDVDSNNLVVKDTDFSNCTMSRYGILSLSGNGAGLYLENVDFANCLNYGIGTALYIDTSYSTSCMGLMYGLTLINCTFEECTARGGGMHPTPCGGAIYSNGTGNTWRIEGCTFHKCDTSNVGDGGAMYINGDNCTFVFSNTVFSECEADTAHDGGAIFVNGNNITLNGVSDNALNNTCVIQDCFASDGGGIFTSSAIGCGNRVRIYGFDFIGNEAVAGEGGAVCICGSKNVVQRCFFKDNTASECVTGGYGGAVFVGIYGEDSLVGVGEGGDVAYCQNIFYHNYAEDEGNEVYLNDKDAKVRGNKFYAIEESQLNDASNVSDLFDSSKDNRGNEKIILGSGGDVVKVEITHDPTEPYASTTRMMSFFDHMWDDLSEYVRPYEGYKFEGWYADREFTKPFSQTARIIEGFKVYAKWAEITDTYNVTYEAKADETWGIPKDAAQTEIEAYKYNAEVTVASALTTTQTDAIDPNTKEVVPGTWKFGGWDRTEAFRITEDTTITGSWKFTPAKYTLTYDAIPDSSWGAPKDCAAQAPEELEHGSLVTPASALVTEQGWALASDNSKTPGVWTFSGWDRTEAFKITVDTTITGSWDFEPAGNCFVKYEVNAASNYWGMPADSVTPQDNKSHFAGTTIELPQMKTEQRYANDRLSMAEVPGTWSFAWDRGDFVITDNPTIVTGAWTFYEDSDPGSFQVIYAVLGDGTYGMPEGGSAAPEDKTAYADGDTVTVVPAFASDQEYAMLDGKKVEGFWSFAWDHEDFQIAEDTVILGRWVFEPGKRIHVTYAVNGDDFWGVPEDSVVPTDSTAYRYDAKVAVAPALTSDLDYAIDPDIKDEIFGTWVFEGWDKTENPFNIKDDTTITGSWKFKPAQCALTYGVDSDSSWGVPEDCTVPKSETWRYGILVTPAPALVTEQGWALESDGETKHPGTWTFSGWDRTEAFKITEDTTIAGSWHFEPAGYCFVKYEVNAASNYWGMPADSVTPQDNKSHFAGTTIELPQMKTEQRYANDRLSMAEVPGIWVFEWDRDDFVITENTTVYGTWTFYKGSGSRLEAEVAEEKIDALPAPENVAIDDKDAIVAARSAFDVLDDEQKALVPDEALQKLEAAESRLTELERAALEWSEPVYTWADDCSICLAKRSCLNDDSVQAEIAEAVVTSEVKTPATCAAKGTTCYTATFDEEWAEAQTKELQNIEKKAHTYSTAWTVDKRATASADGSKSHHCTACGAKKDVTAIPMIKSVALSTTTYQYTGKAKNPTLTVKDAKGKVLAKNTDYTVTVPSGRTKVGTYAYKVTFKGAYSGTAAKTIKVNPAKANLKRLTPGKNSLTWTSTSRPAHKSGDTYQVQFRRYGQTDWKWGTSSKTYYGKIGVNSKLAKGKRYQVRIRAVKTVDGTKYYGAWSAIMTSAPIK